MAAGSCKPHLRRSSSIAETYWGEKTIMTRATVAICVVVVAGGIAAAVGAALASADSATEAGGTVSTEPLGTVSTEPLRALRPDGPPGGVAVVEETTQPGPPAAAAAMWRAHLAAAAKAGGDPLITAYSVIVRDAAGETLDVDNGPLPSTPVAVAAAPSGLAQQLQSGLAANAPALDSQSSQRRWPPAPSRSRRDSTRRAARLGSGRGRRSPRCSGASRAGRSRTW